MIGTQSVNFTYDIYEYVDQDENIIYFKFCIFMFFIWNGSMMKSTWMLSQVGSLKRAPFSEETLEKYVWFANEC